MKVNSNLHYVLLVLSVALRFSAATEETVVAKSTTATTTMTTTITPDLAEGTEKMAETIAPVAKITTEAITTPQATITASVTEASKVAGEKETDHKILSTQEEHPKSVTKRDLSDLSGLDYIVEEVVQKIEGLPNIEKANEIMDAVGKTAESLVIPEDAIKAEPELLKEKEQRSTTATFSLRSSSDVNSVSSDSVSGSVGSSSSISSNGGGHPYHSHMNLQVAASENQEWYDTFGEYTQDVVSTPVRWLELSLCSYNATTNMASVGAQSMIPLDVCIQSAYHGGKKMEDHSSNFTDGHYISYKANITDNVVSIFYDYDCNNNATAMNATLAQSDLFGHINTTDICTKSTTSNPLYSAKIYTQSTIPPPPSYNGRLEKWYNGDDCSGTMTGWSYIKSDMCMQDSSKMLWSTANPDGYPFVISATNGTEDSGGDIYFYPNGNGQCAGNTTSGKTLGTNVECADGLALLQRNDNYTVFGEIGLGTKFTSAWLPTLDTSKTDAVDIALTGDVNSLSALMDTKGVEFLMKDNFGVTAASIGAARGDLDTVKLLVTRGGVSIDAKGNTGNTFLAWAAKYGNINLVNYLISQNADLNQKNGEGKSALTLAYENGFSNIANVLLAAGASVL